MIFQQELRQHLHRLLSDFPGLVHSDLLPVCDTPNHGPYFPTEDEAGLDPRPLLFCVLPMRCREELLARSLGVFEQNVIMSVIHSIYYHVLHHPFRRW